MAELLVRKRSSLSNLPGIAVFRIRLIDEFMLRFILGTLQFVSPAVVLCSSAINWRSNPLRGSSTTLPSFVTVLLHFTLPLLRPALFIAAAPLAAPIIVLGFDLLHVVQVREIQAAFLENRPALFVETSTATLPQPVERVDVDSQYRISTCAPSHAVGRGWTTTRFCHP